MTSIKTIVQIGQTFGATKYTEQEKTQRAEYFAKRKAKMLATSARMLAEENAARDAIDDRCERASDVRSREFFNV